MSQQTHQVLEKNSAVQTDTSDRINLRPLFRIIKIITPEPYGNRQENSTLTCYYIFPTGICCNTEISTNKLNTGLETLNSVFYLDEGPTDNDIALKYFLEDISRYTDDYQLCAISGTEGLQMIREWKKRLDVKMTGEDLALLQQAENFAKQLGKKVVAIDDLENHLKMINDNDTSECRESLSDDSFNIITDDPNIMLRQIAKKITPENTNGKLISRETNMDDPSNQEKVQSPGRDRSSDLKAGRPTTSGSSEAGHRGQLRAYSSDSSHKKLDIDHSKEFDYSKRDNKVDIKDKSRNSDLKAGSPVRDRSSEAFDPLRRSGIKPDKNNNTSRERKRTENSDKNSKKDNTKDQNKITDKTTDDESGENTEEYISRIQEQNRHSKDKHSKEKDKHSRDKK